MFNWLKKKKQPEIVKTSSAISFKDLTLQDIFIEIKPNGNESLLNICEAKSNCKIVLDQELCIILSIILQSYGKEGKIDNILTMLNEINKKDKK